VTSYQYNNANRLTSLTNPFNETTGLQYDAVGRLTRQNNANGTYGTWTFDAGGQISNVATKKSNNSVVLTMDYTRDNVGSPTQVAEQLLDTDNQTVHNATLTFGYDNANRLTLEKRTRAPVRGCASRPRRVHTRTGSHAHRLTHSASKLLTHGNLTFGYDGNGNRTSKTVNQVTTTYAYNHDNRLTELHDGATLTFSYNGDGLRQSRTVNGATTQYAYDGVRLLKELDAAGATQTTCTLAPLGDEWYPLLSDRKAGASRFYAFDALGSTRAICNLQSEICNQYTYDAYGNVLTATDPAATPHQYIGKLGYYTDAASGLQLLTQRYYDPAVGRFVTEDPVKDGGNWWEYVENDPGSNVDPSGLASCGRELSDCNATCDRAARATRLLLQRGEAECHRRCDSRYGPGGPSESSFGLESCHFLCSSQFGTQLMRNYAACMMCHGLCMHRYMHCIGAFGFLPGGIGPGSVRPLPMGLSPYAGRP